MASEPDDQIFLAQENYFKVVDLMSGIKARFVEQGWHEGHAEIATIELILGRKEHK